MSVVALGDSHGGGFPGRYYDPTGALGVGVCRWPQENLAALTEPLGCGLCTTQKKKATHVHSCAYACAPDKHRV
jgi:hypothetical protein